MFRKKKIGVTEDIKVETVSTLNIKSSTIIHNSPTTILATLVCVQVTKVAARKIKLSQHAKNNKVFFGGNTNIFQQCSNDIFHFSHSIVKHIFNWILVSFEPRRDVVFKK